VLASEPYGAEEYLTDYSQFLEFRKARF
jgi:hypothetical protein